MLGNHSSFLPNVLFCAANTLFITSLYQQKELLRDLKQTKKASLHVSQCASGSYPSRTSYRYLRRKMTIFPTLRNIHFHVSSCLLSFPTLYFYKKKMRNKKQNKYNYIPSRHFCDNTVTDKV